MLLESGQNYKRDIDVHYFCSKYFNEKVIKLILKLSTPEFVQLRPVLKKLVEAKL
jgi:hypothetical protein